ncbi:hypothetical protein BDD12DRAFT_844868 [Trichophaea hybrida]|nr:hypothetical protein BDD12DRAFT_844868 [Trichophaea hybrida]
MDDEKRLDELTTTNPTMVMWPKSTDAGNPSPVTDTLQDFKQQALQANVWANTAELIRQDKENNLSTLRELEKMGLGTLMADHEKIMAKNEEIEMGNKSLKEENEVRKMEIKGLKEENEVLKMEIKGLKEEMKDLYDIVLKVSFPRPQS